MNVKIGEFQVKDIDFGEGKLLVVRDKGGVFWIAVRHFCETAGFNGDKIRYEMKRIKQVYGQQNVKRLQIRKGGRKEGTPLITCMEINAFLTWVRNMNITEPMRRNNPDVAKALRIYRSGSVKYMLMEALSTAFRVEISVSNEAPQMPDADADVDERDESVRTSEPQQYTQQYSAPTTVQGAGYQIVQIAMPTFDENFKRMNRELEDQFAKLNQKIDDLYDNMGKFVQLVNSKVGTGQAAEENKEVTTNTPVRKRPVALSLKELEEMKEEVSLCEMRKWKKRMTLMATQVVGDGQGEYPTILEVMKSIYDYMNRNYGIVWIEEIKEYMSRFGGTCSKAHTIDVVYSKEMLRSIYEAVLTDLLYKSGFEQGATDKEPSSAEAGETDTIIEPLAKVLEDKTNSYAITYRKVYGEMRTSGVKWLDYEKQYQKKYQVKTTPTKKTLVENSPALMEKFKVAVDSILGRLTLS